MGTEENQSSKWSLFRCLLKKKRQAHYNFITTFRYLPPIRDKTHTLHAEMRMLQHSPDIDVVGISKAPRSECMSLRSQINQMHVQEKPSQGICGMNDSGWIDFRGINTGNDERTRSRKHF
jgi:hypothetical protein